MKSNTQNAKIEVITEKTLVFGIDVGSETHYASAFDYRGIGNGRRSGAQAFGNCWVLKKYFCLQTRMIACFF